MDAAGAAEGGGDEASVAQLRTFIRLRPVPEARPTVVARTDRRVLLLRVSPWGCRPPTLTRTLRHRHHPSRCGRGG